MSGDGASESTSGWTVGQESSVTVNMPTGCRCGFYPRDGDDPEFFTWKYFTLCPIGPKDHKAVWRPGFKGVIQSHLGLAQLPGGAQIIIDGGSVSAIVPFCAVVEVNGVADSCFVVVIRCYSRLAAGRGERKKYETNKGTLCTMNTAMCSQRK